MTTQHTVSTARRLNNSLSPGCIILAVPVPEWKGGKIFAQQATSPSDHNKQQEGACLCLEAVVMSTVALWSNGRDDIGLQRVLIWMEAATKTPQHRLTRTDERP